MENKACSCGLSSTVQELVKVNHQWQKDYNKVVLALEDCNNKLRDAQKEIFIIESKGKNESPPFTAIAPSVVKTKSELVSIADIEALKQQVVAYKEDYTITKTELHTALSELRETKTELERYKDAARKLTSENHNLAENFKRVDGEKQHILKELQRLTTNMNAFQFQDQAQFKGYVERD